MKDQKEQPISEEQNRVPTEEDIRREEEELRERSYRVSQQIGGGITFEEALSEGIIDLDDLT